MSEFSVVGRRLPKVNAWAHLTGTALYADDIRLPRMLHGRLLRSTQPHARIKRVDLRTLRRIGERCASAAASISRRIGAPARDEAVSA